MTWFVYDPDNGFETFDTEEEAMEWFKSCIQVHRDNVKDMYWSHDVLAIRVGKITNGVDLRWARDIPDNSICKNCKDDCDTCDLCDAVIVTESCRLPCEYQSDENISLCAVLVNDEDLPISIQFSNGVCTEAYKCKHYKEDMYISNGS